MFSYWLIGVWLIGVLVCFLVYTHLNKMMGKPPRNIFNVIVLFSLLPIGNIVFGACLLMDYIVKLKEKG